MSDLANYTDKELKAELVDRKKRRRALPKPLNEMNFINIIDLAKSMVANKIKMRKGRFVVALFRLRLCANSRSAAIAV